MRKYTLTLFLFQLFASTIVLMAEANTRSSDFKATSTESTKEVDPEKEANEETDVFPDLLSFAMHLYQ